MSRSPVLLHLASRLCSIPSNQGLFGFKQQIVGSIKAGERGPVTYKVVFNRAVTAAAI
jgi:hypothetical protein